VADSPGLPLTPLSSLESEVVAHNIINKKIKRATYPAQPSVVFTLPNLASVGFSEKDAKEGGYEVTVEHKQVKNWFNAKRINEKVYAYKTIVDNKNGQIIGVHLVGPKAAEVINLFALAMNCKTDVNSLKQMLFAYPTWGNDIKG
jgi:glutathione reductase (NADPH)